MAWLKSTRRGVSFGGFSGRIFFANFLYKEESESGNCANKHRAATRLWKHLHDFFFQIRHFFLVWYHTSLKEIVLEKIGSLGNPSQGVRCVLSVLGVLSRTPTDVLLQLTLLYAWYLVEA